MRVIMELEGVLCDVEPAWWWAYGRACAAIQAARTDPQTFWRLIRSAAPVGQLLKAVRPGLVQTFTERFEELRESDEAIAHYRAHDRIADQLATCGRTVDRVLITLGANREARQRVLREAGLVDLFAEMHALRAAPHNRAAELLRIAEDGPAVLICSSDALLRASDRADLPVHALGNGTCTPRRLHQAGASDVYPDLAALLDTGFSAK